MKKPIRMLGMILTASMILSMTACKRDRNSLGESRTSRETKEATATEETTDNTSENTSKETTEDTTKDTTKDTTTDTSKSDPSGSDTTSDPSESKAPVQLLGDVPEEGCKIEFAPEDRRYHYNMDLTLDTEKHTIGGHVEFTFFNDSDEDWEKLCLRDYSSLFIDAATAGYDGAIKTNGATTKIENITDGRTSETLKMERDKDVSVVWVPLPEKLKPGEKMTLTYDFVATIPTVADRYGVQDGVFNVTNFYPILAEYTEDGWSHAAFYNTGECFYSEVSDYDVKITVPEDMVVLTTGLENGEEKKGDSKTMTFHADCVRDFVFCASEDFKIVEGDYDGTHVRVAYTEEDRPDLYKQVAEECLRASYDSLKAFNSAFGKYPYKDLEVILAPIDAGGMEYPNLVIVTKTLPQGLENNADFLKEYISYIADEVVSHEIGHQWFMGIVGSNSGMQPWLDESFASFTEYVYKKEVDPDGEEYMSVFDGMGNQTYDELRKSMEAHDFAPINRPFYDFSDENAYIYAVYYFGKDALFEMSKAVGRENFYGIIREYVHRNAFTNADQSDFFDVLYELAGTDNEHLNNVIKVFFDDEALPKAS